MARAAQLLAITFAKEVVTLDVRGVAGLVALEVAERDCAKAMLPLDF